MENSNYSCTWLFFKKCASAVVSAFSLYVVDFLNWNYEKFLKISNDLLFDKLHVSSVLSIKMKFVVILFKM